MIDLLLGQFLPYITGAIGLLLAFVGIKSMVQESKIKKQDETIKVHQVNEAQLVQAVESQKKVIEITERSNEILNSNTSYADAYAKLLKQAEQDSDSNGGKL